MSTFRFKKFSVTNEKSAMKVNTDGVLLGAVVKLSDKDSSLLDIGTGTGAIALMLAQRRAEHSENGKDWNVEAIDIDPDSAAEAAENFRHSPWSGHMKVRTIPLAQLEEGHYDLICSNPPYFDDSLTNPEIRKTTARHTASMSYREILDYAGKNLNPGGRVAMVLPQDIEKHVLRYARMCGLGLQRITRVRTVPRKAPSRIIVEFETGRTEVSIERELTIQDGGQYTEEYLRLMHDFYLFA